MHRNYGGAEPETVFLSNHSSADSGSAEPRSPPEPMPEWSSAVLKWGVAWEIHQYGFGGIFLLTALWAFISFVRDRGRRRKSSLVILTLVALFGVCRGLCLCIDAYNHSNVLPAVVFNILWSVGNPCLVSAYAMLFVVLRNALLMKQAFKAWYTTRNVILVATAYFSFVFTTEVVLYFVPSVKSLTFTCQMLYVIFSLCLITFYSYISVMLKKRSSEMKLQKRFVTRTKFAWTVKQDTRNRTCAQGAIKLLIATVVGGLALLSMQIYSMASVYGVFSGAQYVAAWQWLGFNSLMRATEMYLATLLYLVSVKQCTGRHSSS